MMSRCSASQMKLQARLALLRNIIVSYCLMEVNALINSIYESSGDTQIELIDLLQELVTSTKHVVIGDLSRLFLLIRSLLEHQTNAKTILATHRLITAVREESEASRPRSPLHQAVPAPAPERM